MRKIKIRAWQIEGKYWIEHHKLFETNPYYQNPFTRSDIELVEFTGLSDKNGKEIYEGDIVKYHDYYESFGKVKQDERKIFPIVWDFKGLRFQVEESNEFGKWMANFYHHKEIEVIGNIYENSELLKQ